MEGVLGGGQCKCIGEWVPFHDVYGKCKVSFDKPWFLLV